MFGENFTDGKVATDTPWCSPESRRLQLRQIQAFLLVDASHFGFDAGKLALYEGQKGICKYWLARIKEMWPGVTEFIAKNEMSHWQNGFPTVDNLRCAKQAW